ncbi:MAG: phosphoribosylanthranilate isomerase [Pseudomonadota bacterium]
MTRVKICGLKDGDMVRRAAESGAHWIGLNFVPASPRFVSLDAAASLLLHVRGAVPVALVADFSDDEIDAVAALDFPVLQLHGAETPSRVAEIKARTGREVWKAVGVSTRTDLEALPDYDAADRFVIDAKPPKDAAYAGGHGAVFDWSILSGWRAPKPWLLAGGLTPGNVAEAIRETGAQAVDVSSGVEKVRGWKSAQLIADFLAAAKAA